MNPKLNTQTIRRLARTYELDMPTSRLISDTIPAMCDEIDALRAEVERLDKLAYLRIRLPWRRS